jgi:hypothetical protein
MKIRRTISINEHVVVINAAEFDAFMAAHKRMVREAERLEIFSDLDLTEALDDLRELEERT